MLEVCETFVSLCGETSWQGLPAFFVRTSGCNLRCPWCDTTYAWEPGTRRAVASVVDEAESSGLKLAVITGGEPLLQAETNTLFSALADHDWTVLVETNGTLPITGLNPRARRIVDVKPTSARAAAPFLLANLDDLRTTDELKFVIANKFDFDEAVEFIRRYQLVGRCGLLVSPVHIEVNPRAVAEWILLSRLPLRLQLQLHKILWGPDARGR
jgi:7-carboxy-7-deazaguanine synthase